MKTAPPPDRFEASTSPPKASAIRFTIARPMPVPPGFVEKKGEKPSYAKF